MKIIKHTGLSLTAMSMATGLFLGTPPAHAEYKLLWGDTHVHSANSADAFINGNRDITPEKVYRFARGEPIIHPWHRMRIQITEPLDFIVIADHAEFYAVPREVYFNGMQLGEDAGMWARTKAWFIEKGMRILFDSGLISGKNFDRVQPREDDPRTSADQQLTRSVNFPNRQTIESKAWHEANVLADRYNEPGKFTTFIGWEWTSGPGGANLHRVIMTTLNQQQADTFIPFSASDSSYPADLWHWLDTTEQQTGGRFLAIPHNSNISKGFMFDTTSLRGEPIDAGYATLRSRWEKVAEVTQIKGDSETHPTLSPNDEFAAFETYGWYMTNTGRVDYQPKVGDYLRSALRRGLEMEKSLGINPYQLGLIGSSDNHTGLPDSDETHFTGKHADLATPESNGDPKSGPNGWSMSAQGMAAVWAEDNTRESIMDAFQRREVYATTGPRIVLQFFAGWNLQADPHQADAPVLAREQGVSMGGELSAHGTQSPDFMIFAMKPANGANLDRIQIVKGWLNADGSSVEKVYDVAWSGDRKPSREGKIPTVGNTVDLRTGKYSNSIGASQLVAKWQDPDFDPRQPAFYYARVLQIPTVHHLLLDALALGLDSRPDGGTNTIQERAYSSPIWYKP